LTETHTNDWDIDPPGGMGPSTGEIIDRMDRAAILMRREPLRRGNMVHLPPQGDVVIVGDLHGDTENFTRIVEWSNLQRNKDRYLVLQELIHGGPLDAFGGDNSFRLLEEAARLKCQFRSQVHMVLSNHDLCEILGSTVSKGDRNVSAPFWKGIENAYGPIWPEVHGSYRRFLASLPLAVRTSTGVVLSHSTPQTEDMAGFDCSIFERPLTMDDYLPDGSVHSLVWGRHHDQHVADAFAKCVGAELLITGHQNSMPGIKTPTTRHIILTSDGPLGRFLMLRLNVQAPFHVVLRQVTKIRDL
jgi:serine/threonine-protein phosphatase PP1 catalytic subunit